MSRSGAAAKKPLPEKLTLAAGVVEEPTKEIALQLSGFQDYQKFLAIEQQMSLLLEEKISEEEFAERKETIEAVFTAQEILNLSHWEIIFIFSPNEDEGEISWAETVTWDSTNKARITFYPSFFQTSLLDRTETVFHELIHLYTQPLRRTVSLVAGRVSRELEVVIEKQVQEMLENVTATLAGVIATRLSIGLFSESEGEEEQ